MSCTKASHAVSVIFMPACASFIDFPGYSQPPPEMSQISAMSIALRKSSFGPVVLAKYLFTRVSATTLPRNDSTMPARPSCPPRRSKSGGGGGGAGGGAISTTATWGGGSFLLQAANVATTAQRKRAREAFMEGWPYSKAARKSGPPTKLPATMKTPGQADLKER